LLEGLIPDNMDPEGEPVEEVSSKQLKKHSKIKLTDHASGQTSEAEGSGKLVL
jgi:hypothetical protein